MARTKYGKTIALTTIGVVKQDRIKVFAIEFVNTTANHTATLGSWYGSGLHSTVNGGTVGIATGVVTSTGNFAATGVTALDVIHFEKADLAANNNVAVLVASRDSDNQITAGPVTELTDDTTGIYSWKVYTPVQEVKITADATTGINPIVTFLGGRWFNNLVLTQLNAGTVYVYYE